ncbi:hypothetical protein WDC_0639 [Paucilactobacillus wasatchensis]|uniref:Uncharacterized protein n=1 Tax=Paucilactobacillus wasatchensis TaxID=1335616 RepID=A0A0D1A7Q3_9LACO|nr:hypothetical protein WDC_0639 [Paucilactobacillus wasatchensis]
MLNNTKTRADSANESHVFALLSIVIEMIKILFIVSSGE